MHRRMVPLVAGGTALMWLTAQALDLPWLAAATVVAGLGAPALLALGRRPGARRRAGLLAGLTLLMLLLTAGLGLQLVLHDAELCLSLGLAGHPALPLVIDLALVAILAPLAPLVYAWTASPPGEPPGKPPEEPG